MSQAADFDDVTDWFKFHDEMTDRSAMQQTSRGSGVACALRGGQRRMYESFFGFQRRPFAMTPDPGCFHAPEGVQAVLDELVVCAEQGLGIGILTGPAGVGKTLLCERLSRELSARLVVVLFRHGHFPSRRGLLQSLLCELGQPYSKLSEHELRLELLPIVREIRDRGQSLVIVCDEAHALSEEHLEELRMLSDLAENGMPLVRLILCGQLGLEEKLAHPLLGPLGQRVAAQLCLLPLLRADTLDYVDYRTTWAGRSAAGLFTTGALDLVHRICDGLPRCINQLCDHALLLAYVADAPQVTEAHVRESLDDLRRLPLQWHEPAQTSWFSTQHESSEPESLFPESSFSESSFSEQTYLEPDTVSGTVLDFVSSSEEPSDTDTASNTGWQFSGGSEQGLPGVDVESDELTLPARLAELVALEAKLYGASESTQTAVFESGDWEQVGACEPRYTLRMHTAVDQPATSTHLFDVTLDAEPVVSRVQTQTVFNADMPIESGGVDHAETNSAITEEIVVDRYSTIDAGQLAPVASVSPGQASTGDAWALELPESQDLAETARRWSEAIELSPVYSNESLMAGAIKTSTTPEEQLKSAVMELVHAARYAVGPQSAASDGPEGNASHSDDRDGADSTTDAESLTNTEADDADPRFMHAPTQTDDDALSSDECAEACAFEVGHDMVNQPLGSHQMGTTNTGSANLGPQSFHHNQASSERVATPGTQSAQPAPRPYRHLFSLLRRKQSGLQ